MRQLRSLFGLLVVVAVFYLIWKIVPPYFANYQFQDAINSTARLNSVNPNNSEEMIRQSVYKEAASLSIPLKAEDIQVRRTGQDVIISADYSVHVDIPMYPLDLEFHPASDKK